MDKLIGNAFAAGAYAALKEAVGPAPLLSVMVDALYANTVSQWLNGYVQALLKGNTARARDNLDKAGRVSNTVIGFGELK